MELYNFSKYKDFFNSNIIAIIDEYCESDTLKEMILYSLNKGKRLRPIISMDICNSLCQNPEKVLKFALGLELIHTSCLIIDDMPCMDNDNYRRGELSFHKKLSCFLHIKLLNHKTFFFYQN